MLRLERYAFSAAIAATVLACVPAIILMMLGYAADRLVLRMFWGGLAAIAIAAVVGILLRRKRLNGRVMLQDLRTGSTVSRGVSPLGKTRNHLGVSPASAFIVMSALAMALGGLAFVYVNLWDY